jgi:CxxC motif-containing protein
MVETTHIICVTCPKGCTLEVNHDGLQVVEIKPGCKRGHEYARHELIDPRRNVATSVRISGTVHPLLPVYTSAPFPKKLIPELLAEIRRIEIESPVNMGEAIIKNVLDTGIDILASRDM